MGVFIEIALDASRLKQDQARRLTAACPVDIYALEAGQLVVRPDQVDECTLCELCLELAPPGAIKILKLYNGQQLVARGVKLEP